MPCGRHAIGVSRDGEVLLVGYLRAKALLIEFAEALDRVPSDAVVVTMAQEITRRDAMEVRAMRSPLVPDQAYLAILAERIHATNEVMKFYRRAGDWNRGMMLQHRARRLNARIGRVQTEAMARWRREPGRVGAAMLVTSDYWRAAAAFLGATNLTAEGVATRVAQSCLVLFCIA
jgi:hypothetical protein